MCVGCPYLCHQWHRNESRVVVMNYYLLRSAFTDEVDCLFATPSVCLSGRAEEISQAEYETYRDLHGFDTMEASEE